ncbi:MAG TPA: hypothetical protein VM386_01825 [Acidimicrobiales bacterium]|nr:hypothetical protein [Acidimicrobiales bacterium]
MPEAPSAGPPAGPALPPSWRERLDLLGAGPALTLGRVAAGAVAAVVAVVVVVLVLRGPPPPPELSAGSPGPPATLR